MIMRCQPVDLKGPNKAARRAARKGAWRPRAVRWNPAFALWRVPPAISVNRPPDRCWGPRAVAGRALACQGTAAFGRPGRGVPRLTSTIRGPSGRGNDGDSLGHGGGCRPPCACCCRWDELVLRGGRDADRRPTTDRAGGHLDIDEVSGAVRYLEGLSSTSATTPGGRPTGEPAEEDRHIPHTRVSSGRPPCAAVTRPRSRSGPPRAAGSCCTRVPSCRLPDPAAAIRGAS